MRRPETTDGTTTRIRHHLPRPRTLAALSLAAMTVVAVIASVNHRPDTPAVTVLVTSTVRPAGTAGPVVSVGTVTVTSMAVVADGPGTTPPDVLPTVNGFLAGWLTPADPDWRALVLGPYTTGDFLPVVARVDRVPQATVVDTRVVSVDAMTGVVGFSLSDGSSGRVGVVMTAAGWRVASIDRT